MIGSHDTGISGSLWGPSHRLWYCPRDATSWCSTIAYCQSLSAVGILITNLCVHNACCMVYWEINDWRTSLDARITLAACETQHTHLWFLWCSVSVFHPFLCGMVFIPYCLYVHCMLIHHCCSIKCYGTSCGIISFKQLFSGRYHCVSDMRIMIKKLKPNLFTKMFLLQHFVSLIFFFFCSDKYIYFIIIISIRFNIVLPDNSVKLCYNKFWHKPINSRCSLWLPASKCELTVNFWKLILLIYFGPLIFWPCLFVIFKPYNLRLKEVWK